MTLLLLYLFLCFLTGYFFWDRAPRWRYPILFTLGVGLCVGYFFLRKF